MEDVLILPLLLIAILLIIHYQTEDIRKSNDINTGMYYLSNNKQCTIEKIDQTVYININNHNYPLVKIDKNMFTNHIYTIKLDNNNIYLEYIGNKYKLMNRTEYIEYISNKYTGSYIGIQHNTDDELYLAYIDGEITGIMTTSDYTTMEYTSNKIPDISNNIIKIPGYLDDNEITLILYPKDRTFYII